MVSCAACGCSKTPKNKSAGITFHTFPKDSDTRTAWTNFVNKPEWVPGTSYLCSQHFVENCFDRTSKMKVRLIQNACPTIEVSRLKYVRTFNPIRTKLVNNPTSDMLTGPNIAVKEVNYNEEPVPGPSKLILPGPYRQRCTTPTPTVDSFNIRDSQQDTPHIISLKRKISKLQVQNTLQSQKIRRLQKMAWRQKKNISSMKSIILELKRKKLVLEEHQNVLLQHFECDTDLITRLFRKTRNKCVPWRPQQ
ncbi:hypothetical protein RI129_006226 [Pyrocoelia pectoralis]|uniref:THAP-type domain-containing protein n=1 Tax=Pyrocoelia pectoralis TaxID=417401 RepID=A0AAN7VGV4_9COLE